MLVVVGDKSIIGWRSCALRPEGTGLANFGYNLPKSESGLEEENPE